MLSCIATNYLENPDDCLIAINLLTNLFLRFTSIVKAHKIRFFFWKKVLYQLVYDPKGIYIYTYFKNTL